MKLVLSHALLARCDELHEGVLVSRFGKITFDNAIPFYNGRGERQRSAATRYTSPAAQIALDPTDVAQRGIHSGSAALLL
jgi:hypothetical protein